MRTLEIGIRAGSACNDRDSIRERTRDPPRYLSVWNFLRWESLFLVENKKSYESNVLFRFLPLSFFFLDFDSFLFRFFLSKRKRNFICLTFFFQSSLTTGLEWISDYESFPFPLDTMPMYFA